MPTHLPRPRAAIALLLTAAGLACLIGCTKSATAPEFMELYLGAAPPAQSECGWFSTYAGRDQRYHYLDVTFSNFGGGPFAMMFGGPYREEKYRCRVQDLPATFPDGLEQYKLGSSGQWGNPDLQRFINDYLAKGEAAAPLRRYGPPIDSDGKATERMQQFQQKMQPALPEVPPNTPSPEPGGGI